MKRWLFVIVVLLAAWTWWPQREITRTPGVLVADAPVQTELEGAPPKLTKAGYEIKALARLELEARVLGVERYRFDRGADLSPADLALGWGRMSDTSVVDRVAVSQGGRFYYWSMPEFPIPRQEIETSSANMHVVAANGMIARQLSAVRRGNVIRLGGYLIEARGTDGWRWGSSLTRADTGAGSCELIWVEQLELR